MKSKIDYTQGNISKYLVSLAAPLIVGNILQEFYNTIDAFVVGRFAGTEEFAAIGIAGTAMNLFIFAIVGCCNGFAILFAQACGQKDMIQLRKQHFRALIAGMGCVVLLMLIGILGMGVLLKILQTPVSLQGYVSTYLYWIFMSLPATFLYNLLAALLRASGDTKAALYVLAASVVTNLILDLILVAGAKCGIRGAALATAITQIISAIICYGYLCRTHNQMVLHKADCDLGLDKIAALLKIGLITSLHQSSLYLGKMFVQGAVNTGGTEVIAAYTAATRIEGFANSIGGSGSSSTSIITAQNYGAGQKERIEKIFRCSLTWLIATGIFSALIMYVFAPQTVRQMLGNSDGIAFSEGVRYLRTVAVFYVFCFTGNTFTGYYNGIGKVLIPFLGATGHIIIRIIFSWILFQKMGLNAVALATGIGWVCANCFWGIVKHKKGHAL